MGYRIKPEHHHHRRDTDATVTPSRHYVTNGTKKVLAFPCFYQEILPPSPKHDKHYHDHIGWPSPGHPDHVCQMGSQEHQQNYSYNLIPIHFTDEGYTNFTVSWVEDIHPTITVELDEDDDWVVRATVDAEMPEAVKREKKYHFSIFAATANNERKDMIVLGELIVLPSSY